MKFRLEYNQAFAVKESQTRNVNALLPVKTELQFKRFSISIHMAFE